MSSAAFHFTPPFRNPKPARSDVRYETLKLARSLLLICPRKCRLKGFRTAFFLRFPGWRRIRKRRAGWIVGWVEACRIRRIRQIYRRHSHEGGNPGFRARETFFPDKFPCRPVWIPACAGMTVRVFLTIHRAVATVFFTPSGKNTKTQIKPFGYRFRWYRFRQNNHASGHSISSAVCAYMP